jgi:hypothetical protein
MNFYFIDSNCGTGKTHAILKYISNDQFNRKPSLYVCETVKQADEIANRSKNIYINPINCFYENLKTLDIYLKNVSAARKFASEQNEIKNYDKFPTLAIISWIEFCKMNKEDKAKFETIYIDDIRSCCDQVDFNTPYFFHDIILKHFVADLNNKNIHDDWISLVCFNKFDPKNVYDEIAEKLKKIFNNLESHDIFCLKLRYDRLSKKIIDKSSENKENNRFTIYLKPKKELFDHPNITFLRHDFLNQEIGRIVSSFGYLHEHPAKKYLRKLNHNKNIKINIKVFVESDKPISNTFLTNNDNENYKKLFNFIGENFKQETIGIFRPEYSNDYITHRFPNIKRIDTVSNGLNSYSHYKNIICANPMRLSNERIQFYNDICGFTEEQVTEMFRVSNDYQTILRSALRNFSNQTEEIIINILVLDSYSSNYIKKHVSEIVFEENINIELSGVLKRLNVTRNMKEYKAEYYKENKVEKDEKDDHIDPKVLAKRADDARRAKLYRERKKQEKMSENE